MSDKWEPCPRCGSSRVTASKPGCIVFCIVVILFSLAHLNIAFLILGAISIVALISLIVSKKTQLSCKDCEHNWIYPNSNN